MRIETASGHTILADDADYPVIGEYSWWVKTQKSGHLYAWARVSKAYKSISMHRLLMRPPPELIVHHKNNNGLDNRRCNLQITTQRVNMRYAFEGVKGVHQDKRSGRWRAQPRDETGKQISLGMYETEERARAVVQSWNYRKMLELEEAGSMEAHHLAEVISNSLTNGVRS